MASLCRFISRTARVLNHSPGLCHSAIFALVLVQNTPINNIAMKILFIQFLLLPALLLANGGESLADISKALGEGNITALSKFLDKEVELSVLGEDDFFSNAEATAKLKAFFTKYPASKFSQIHNGVSPSTKAEYCIGNLVAGGKTFRVVIYLTEASGALKIKKMSFDEE